MKHALAVAVVLVGCAKGRPGQTPSHPTSYGSSSGTHVYRTSVTGTTMAEPSDRGAPPAGGGSAKHNETLIAGLVVLGVSYGITVGASQTISATMFSDFDRAIGADDSVARLWVPVLGAWSGLLYNESTVRSNCNAMSFQGLGGNCDLVTAGSIAIAVGAVAQTAGLVMTLYGLLKPPPFRAPVHSARVVVIPHGSPDGGGVSLIGRF